MYEMRLILCKPAVFVPWYLKRNLSEFVGVTMLFGRKHFFYLCLTVLAIMCFVCILSTISETERKEEKDKITLTENSNINGKLQMDYDKSDTNFINKGLNHTMQRLNAEKVNADDPALIAIIKDYYIEKPSDLPYHLDNPEIKDPSCGQSTFVDNSMNHKENGFYVDGGAHNGELYSNSLFLERYRNWTGILIEASPTGYKELRRKHRKAFTLNACLSDRPYPYVMTVLEDTLWGYVVDVRSYKRQSSKDRYVKIQCFPLYSILLALNQTRVDYFSLDVEGAGKGVLDSLPLDKVDIRMMSIEYDKWPSGKSALKVYIGKRGYKYMTEINAPAAADIVVLKE